MAPRTPRYFVSTLASLVLFAAGACSHSRSDADEGSAEVDGGTRADAGKPKPRPEACPTSNPYCRSDAAVPVTPSCGNQPIDLTPVGVNVMVAVDGAASMLPHWPLVQAAVKDLRDTHPNGAFGLQVFWGELANYQSGTAKANWCGATQNRVLDVGDNSAAALVEFLGAMPPGPSYVGGIWETSPVIEPLNYYLQNASKLADPTRTNYLVLLTSGNDNCFGSLFTNKADKLVAFEKLAVELGKLNIRVIPVGFDAATGVDTSGGFYGGTTNRTDVDVLDTLLKFGGSGLTEAPKADDPSKLAEVIEQVGQTVRNCRFEIPATLDPTQAVNPFALDFTVNGVKVERDRLNSEGWNFVDGKTSQVELFGAPCTAVRAGGAVAAQKTCNDNVCGTASIKVETKPRSVLLLLDSSASRIQCTDAGFGCLMLPGSATRVGLTFWETAQHALGVSLASPVNDDVEFGMQFFPSKSAASFSCEVAAEPEVLPAQGTEITILSQMLEKLPFGFSPVVQVLENVAAAPGRLADPAVQGAVVMLSDGGDNCSGVPQEEIVSRLAAASGKLLAAGVKTYVVRYGTADGNTPEQEAQLRAIVANGGTALSDPADLSVKPYIDAQSDAELTAALSTISNTLATCSFSLGGLPDNVDKTSVNLYLNGEVIPFDKQQIKQNGWGWLDAEQTEVELFGESCMEFKSNRKTSVVVELGCAPIIVI